MAAAVLGAACVFTAAAATPTCVDNDATIVAVLARNGITISGCGDVKVTAQCSSNDGIRANCCETCGGVANTPQPECTGDDDAGFVAAYKDQAGITLNGCVDAPSCSDQGIATLCCEYCKGHSDHPPPHQLPPANDDDPVQVYLSAGQSNCKGQGSVSKMKREGRYPELLEADTNKSKVWLAALLKQGEADSFGITALMAGAQGSSFGPEVSIGYRLQELTGRRVLVYKYCWGGSNIREDWNPDHGPNTFDASKDDGSAAFLEPLVSTRNQKTQQYLCFIYYLRVLREQLAAAFIKYEFKGLFWRQGAGDVAYLDWKQYGKFSIRLFSALRQETGTPRLPVIDEANPEHKHIQTGKLYAAKVLCDATTGGGVMSGMDPSSTCVPRPDESCPEDSIVDPRPWNLFGWDSGVPDSMKPPGFSPKTSKWFVRFSADPAEPPNLHDDYEAMVWKGRAMAMALIREHTALSVPQAMTDWDLWARFPAKPCTAAAPWSPTNLCYEDLSAGCTDVGATTGGCGGVTATSCRANPAHYENCSCACAARATCTGVPAPVDLATTTMAPTTAGTAVATSPSAGRTTATVTGTTTAGDENGNDDAARSVHGHRATVLMAGSVLAAGLLGC